MTNQVTQALTSKQNMLWQIALASATVLGSFALACVFPFAGFAALAALTLSRNAGLGLIFAVWAVNQLVGFFILSFPWDAQAVGHGIAILAATLAGFAVARTVSARGSLVVRSISALVGAFVTYEALLWAYAQIGGGAENFTAQIIGEVALNDSLWFAALLAVRYGIGAVARGTLAQSAR